MYYDITVLHIFNGLKGEVGLKRKWWLSLSIGMLVVVLVLSGCGSKEVSPKELMRQSMESSMKVDSYDFSTTFKIRDLNVESPELSNTPEVAMIYEWIKNAELSVKGAFKKDPMQMEVNELCIVLQLFNGCCSAISHTCA